MHHNSQKRFHNNRYTYFITAKTHQSFPYFKEEIFCELFVEELKLCKKLKKFELFAFGLNYDHFHLMVKPGDKANISEIMRSLKTNYSRNVNRIIDNVDSKATSRDVAFESLLENHIKYLQSLCEKFLQKHEPNQLKIPKFKWQKSFHDHIIRNQKDFDNHLHYTAYNFLKHNLPENWKYTSQHYPELIDTF